MPGWCSCGWPKACRRSGDRGRRPSGGWGGCCRRGRSASACRARPSGRAAGSDWSCVPGRKGTEAPANRAAFPWREMRELLNGLPEDGVIALCVDEAHELEPTPGKDRNLLLFDIHQGPPAPLQGKPPVVAVLAGHSTLPDKQRKTLSGRYPGFLTNFLLRPPICSRPAARRTTRWPAPSTPCGPGSRTVPVQDEGASRGLPHCPRTRETLNRPDRHSCQCTWPRSPPAGNDPGPATSGTCGHSGASHGLQDPTFQTWPSGTQSNSFEIQCFYAECTKVRAILPPLPAERRDR